MRAFQDIHTHVTHVLVDHERPACTLSVDFDAFVERLVSLGEPEQKRLDSLMAGVDLISALESESDDFASAAPGTDASASFAERVAALTDEAFEAAHELLEEGGEYDADTPLTPHNVLVRAVREWTFDDGLYPAIAAALLAAPLASDPAVGKEFV